jgi:hypothetical protein
MLVLTVILVIIALAVIVGRWPVAGPLDIPERLFLFAAPIPVLLVLVLPWPVGEFMRAQGSLRPWSLWLNEVGGWLSLILAVAGAVLLGRRTRQGRAWDQRVVIAVFVAALPALLIGLVALMYALWS